MTRTCTWLAALAAGSILLAPAATAAPLADYGQLPTLQQAVISPSGRLLALEVVKGDQRKIVIEDVATHKLVNGANLGDAKVRWLEWAGDDHLIITTSVYAKAILSVLAAANEWFMASDFNLPQHRIRPLLGDVEYAGNMLEGEPAVRFADGKPVLFATGVHFHSGDGVSLFRIDLDLHHSRLVMDGATGVNDFLMGPGDEPAAETFYDGLSKEWALSVLAGGRWRQALTRVAAIETPDVLGLGRDGRSVLVGENVKDHYEVRELSPDGSLGQPLQAPTQDFGVLHDPVTHRLIGWVSLQGDQLRYRFFSPDDQGQWDAIAAAFKGDKVSLASWSDDRRRMVLEVDSPTQGPGYALVDLTTGSTFWIGSEYQGLGPADIGVKQPIAFTAADGLGLTGYLTLPTGRPQKPLPLVVLVHGGPAARDEPGFDWWAQGLASKGYAVLQVNYRGSAGFGWDFMAAGFGQWGRKMQTDLSDGVRYLAAQGIVDPKRVCIVGASYGGYAALAGAAFDHGVYRCAVDVEGPAELPSFIGWEKDRQVSRDAVTYDRYWDRYMGASGPQDPVLRQISPADHADKIDIPLLIIHGDNDSVVPYAQSQTMAAALKAAGKPFEFVTLKHEDHWLSQSDTRLQMLQSAVEFLEKNNPAG